MGRSNDKQHPHHHGEMIIESSQASDNQKNKPAFKGAKYDASGYCLKHPMIRLCKCHGDNDHRQSLFSTKNSGAIADDGHEESTEEVPVQSKYTIVTACPLCNYHASTNKPKQTAVVSMSHSAEQTSSVASGSSHTKESILDYPIDASPNDVIKIFSPSTWEQKSRKDLKDVLTLVVSKGGVPSLPIGTSESRDDSKLNSSRSGAAKWKEYKRSSSDYASEKGSIEANRSNKAVLRVPLSLDSGKKKGLDLAPNRVEQLTELPFKTEKSNKTAIKKGSVDSSLNPVHDAAVAGKKEYKRLYSAHVSNNKSLEPSLPGSKAERRSSLREILALVSHVDEMEEVPVKCQGSHKPARKSSLQEALALVKKEQKTEVPVKSSLQEALTLAKKDQKHECPVKAHPASKKSSVGRDFSVDSRRATAESRRATADSSLSTSLMDVGALPIVKRVSFHNNVSETRKSQPALSRRHSTGAGHSFSGNGTKFLSYESNKVQSDRAVYKAESFIRCNFILNCRPEKKAPVNNSNSHSNSKNNDKSRGKGKTPLNTKVPPPKRVNSLAESSMRYEVPFNASTGMCTRHPWIPLAVKKRSGGWKIVRDECPECKCH